MKQPPSLNPRVLGSLVAIAAAGVVPAEIVRATEEPQLSLESGEFAISEDSPDSSAFPSLQVEPSRNAEALQPVEAPSLVQVSEELVEISQVELVPTATGVELVLTTPDGQLSPSPTASDNNTLIADIPNAVLTLPDGRFDTDNPAAGIASVSVTQLDATTVRVSVRGTNRLPEAEILPSATGVAIDITTPVQAEDTETIELVVTATRTEEETRNVPRSVTVIDREQIEKQTNVNTSLQDILAQEVPGFGTSPQRNFLTGQSLRGRRPLVLIDGIPQSTNFDSPQQELRTIDPAAIERIEVVRGPASTYGADAAGGVINIITRKPEEDEVKFTAEAGVTNALRGSDDDFGNVFEGTISVREDNADVLFSASREYTGNFFDANGELIPFTEGQDNSETLNFLGKLGIDLSENQRIQLSANHFREEREPEFISDRDVQDLPGVQQARALEIDPEFIGYSTQPQENTILNLEYSNEDLLGSQLKGQIFYRFYNDGQGIPGSLPQLPDFISASTATSKQWGGRLGVETPIGNRANIFWGVDYVNEENSQVESIFDPDTFEASGGRVFEFTERSTVTPPYYYESFGAFAQGQWDITDRLLISGGVRHENAGFEVDDYTGAFIQTLASPPINFLPTANIEGGDRDFSDTTFNAGLVFQASDEVSLFANFAQGFSVVDIGRVLRLPSGFTSVEDDFPQLEPQKIDNYEIGVRGDWDSLRFSLAGFFNESELGSSLLVNDAGFLEIVRAPERIYGVEATLDWQPSESWQLGGTVSWQEGEFDENDDGDFEPLSSARISPLKLTSYIENETLPGWRNRLQMVFLGDRDRAFDEGVDGADIEGFITVDYISSIRLGPGNLEIGVENLFNEKYFTVFSQIQAGEGNETENFASRGRMLRVGYRLTW
jgi:iron complex outermembrane receptor protein